MHYEIEVRKVEPIRLAVVRDRETSATIAAKILGSPVWDYLRSHDIKSGGHNIVVYFNDGRPDFPVEIGADVLAPFESDGKVVNSATPGGLVATTRHVGPYSKLGEAYSALRHWTDRSNLTFKGVSWELYGHWTDDPDELITDLFFLLEE